MTDAERLHDIEQKLRCWGYLAHYPDAERDMAWLLEAEVLFLTRPPETAGS